MAGDRLGGNMCGRYEAFSREQIEQVARDVQSGRLHAVAQEAGGEERRATCMRPGMVAAAIGPGTFSLSQHTWGIANPHGGRPLINARIESAGLSLWQHAFDQGRVIIPARAYFEPHAQETTRANGKERKRQYVFRPADSKPLLMAGISTQGGLVVVTTEALPHLSAIHPRMPLLLHEQDAGEWLEGSWTDVPRQPQVALHVEPELVSGEQLALF